MRMIAVFGDLALFYIWRGISIDDIEALMTGCQSQMPAVGAILPVKDKGS